MSVEGSAFGHEREPSVFGNLPRSRPSIRSPRRADPSDAGAPDQPGVDHAGEPDRGAEAEIAALARAGISLAGGVATLGLRAAGRAATALRDAVERS